MAITLAGKLTDITNRSPDQLTRAMVKYPRYTIGEAGALATSAPREVQVAADGSFTLDVTAGKGWLFLEGPGWSESVGFIAASGMSLFIEAVANFDAQPIYDLIRELISAMGGATEAELAALVEQAKAYYDFIKNSPAAVAPWHKPELGAQNLNDVLVPGTYPQSGSANVTLDRNYPVAGQRGNLTVLPTSELNDKMRIQVFTLESGAVYVRRIYGTGNWSPWTRPQTWKRGVLTGAENLDFFATETEVGGWGVPSVAVAKQLGLPEEMPGFLTVKWVVGNGADSAYVVQTFESVGGSNKEWRRSRMSKNLWTAWVDNTPALPVPSPTVGSVPLTAESRREQLVNSRGGRIGTGGKGVVAFRFDHNVTPFQDKVLPLLRERGLPGSMAHFAQEMTPTEAYTNSNEVGKTWADVSRQFFQGIEVWSHSYTHTDPVDDAAMVKEIVQSRTDLEAFVPEAYVVGWMQPGMTGGKYGGYGDVQKAPEYHGTTRAGQLIDATYGADDRGGVLLTPLGSRNFGCLWIDQATSPTATNRVIDEAAATGVGVVIALHPSVVGAVNSISTATYTAILDHIVELRDAGKIEVLTAGGMSVADPTITWRHNVAPPLSAWSGGAIVSDGKDISSSPLAASFSIGNQPFLHGHIRELAVTCSGAGTVTLNVKDRKSAVALDESRTVTINGTGTARLPFGLARGNTGLTVTITCTSGTLTVSDVKIQAI